jgi:hypothetical protein
LIWCDTDVAGGIVASFPEGRQARRSSPRQPDEIEVLIIPVGSIGFSPLLTKVHAGLVDHRGG